MMDVTRPCFVCSLAASEDLARHQILPGMISRYILSHLKPRLGWLGVTWLALCSCFFIPETDIFLAVGLDKKRGDQSSSRRPPMFAIRPAAPPLRPPQTLAAPSGAELSRAGCTTILPYFLNNFGYKVTLQLFKTKHAKCPYILVDYLEFCWNFRIIYMFQFHVKNIA